MTEIYLSVHSNSDLMSEQKALRMWNSHVMTSLEDLKDLRVGIKLKDLLAGAGLVEVASTIIPLPLSAWARGA